MSLRRCRAVQKTENRALGFSFFTRREAPQTHLSSVPYPLSSETVFCPLKILSSETFASR
ncbi:MAG: hypothetical protein LBD06_04170 [Candidatus Accumulibacter sp.]|nr:hypothetical protein [Accumulibacter sp.]